jgi:hypothetical protein
MNNRLGSAVEFFSGISELRRFRDVVRVSEDRKSMNILGARTEGETKRKVTDRLGKLYGTNNGKKKEKSKTSEENGKI